jgi:RNA polymerase sigma-70 factor, ECF subfamily
MATLPVAVSKLSHNLRDSELVTRAQEGDEEAFATLFEVHKRRVYSLCLQMTGDTADADDLTQDAFIQAFRKLATFRGDSAFSTWLYRIAVNTVLMSLRKRTLRTSSLDEPVNSDTSSVPREYGATDSRLLHTVDRIVLARAVRELPTGYRRIFLLHDVEGYGHGEIARLLHCSTGNSKSQLHKARVRIREFLRSARNEMPLKVTRSAKRTATESLKPGWSLSQQAQLANLAL